MHVDTHYKENVLKVSCLTTQNGVSDFQGPHVKETSKKGGKNKKNVHQNWWSTDIYNRQCYRIDILTVHVRGRCTCVQRK